ncbi:MAG: hypothetical protein IH958_06795 [Chloroflexi bacterium]|nr:hypothetical protein [Chloroflexota bacterium]
MTILKDRDDRQAARYLFRNPAAEVVFERPHVVKEDHVAGIRERVGKRKGGARRDATAE